MMLIRTEDAPIVSRDDILVAVTDGENNLVICISKDAVDEVAQRPLDTEVARFEAIETHWISIAIVAESKLRAGGIDEGYIRIAPSDFEGPIRLD